MSEHSVARAAVGMGSITALSRLLGFVRVLVIAAVLGTTFLGNTFQASNSVSNVMFELLAAGALSAVLVPTFSTLIDDGRAAEAEGLARALLARALILLGAVTVVAELAAPLLARVLSTGAPNAQIASQQRHLATFLLLCFVPQVILYAFGAIATALLYARRRFAITAAAPIGNTIVMVACLVMFRVVAGGDAGLRLTLGEKGLLAVAGTGGVIAFVGTLVVAARRAGHHLVPRFGRADPAVRDLSRHATWGILLHANAGLLLGAALIAGNGVAGGVVAYQVAFVFFLAPAAVLAQPVHTALLPELARDAARGNLDAFAADLRWAIGRITVLLLPVTAAMVTLALPFMQVVAFGRATHTGPALLAAALAALAGGLVPYSAFLLFARAYYALGDSRTPAVVAIASACVGVGVMAVFAPMTHGSARVAVLGLGHSAAYAVGALILGVRLSSRLRRPIVDRSVVPSLATTAPLGIGAWVVVRAVAPHGRVAAALMVAAIGATGAVAYSTIVRWSSGRRRREVAGA